MYRKSLFAKWQLFVLIWILLLTACSNETPVTEQPLPDQPDATATPTEEVAQEPEALPEPDEDLGSEEEMPEVTHSSRCLDRREQSLNYNGTAYPDNAILFVDPDFLNMSLNCLKSLILRMLKVSSLLLNWLHATRRQNTLKTKRSSLNLETLYAVKRETESRLR